VDACVSYVALVLFALCRRLLKRTPAIGGRKGNPLLLRGQTLDRLQTDYCVVGAGFAGLAAARRLRDCGKSVVLVEARDRVGGRVWNRTAADGTVVSMGGTWLGRRQDRMFELCREFGLDVYPQYEQGDIVLQLDGRNRRYRGYPKAGLFALVSLGLAFWQLDRMVERLPLDEPWNTHSAKALDAQTLGGWIDSPWHVPSATARKLIRTTMTVLFCVDPDEVSLLGSLVLARGGGSFEYYVDSTITETHLVDGGAPELAVRMAGKLGNALQLSSPVRRIEQSSAGVEVFSDQLTVEGRRVIVAIPPFLASHIDYEPPLPPTHIQLLRRMLSGSAIRGITIYDEPFWRSEGLSGMSVAPDLPVPVALDQSPRSGKPGILSSYMFGPQAVRVAALAPVERRHVWLQALAARYGSKALWPRAHMETDWAAEEWSLGGMIAHFAPGVLTNYGRALREPAGRIHWAASEYATEMHGLMEGAVRSGESAAQQVISADA
jgi:monoamine oxidase